MSSKFIYVISVNDGIGTISQYTRDLVTGDLTEVTPAITYDDGYIYDKIIVDSAGKFVYLLSSYLQYDGTYYNRIFQYIINQSTGALTLITGGTNPIKTSCGTAAICDDGKGKYLYTACAYSYDGNYPSILCKYNIDQVTGQLTVLGTPTVLTYINYPFSGMCKTILGKYLYIVRSAPNKITTYEINQTTGDITEVGTPLDLSGNTTHLCDDGTGNYIYSASWSAAQIDGFSINQTTGLLTNIGTIVSDSYNVMGDGTGKFLYTTPSSSGLITELLIGLTGTLTSIGTIVVSNNGPCPIANSGDGEFLYTIDPLNNQIIGLSINTSTGVLTSLVNPFICANNPIAICNSTYNGISTSSSLGYQFSTYPPSPVFDVLSYKDTEVLADTVTVNPDVLEPTDNLVISTPKVSTVPETTGKQRITDTIDKLNNFLAAAKEMQVVLDGKLQDYVVKVDVNKNPHVRDAIRRLFGIDSNVITYDMFKKVLEMRSQYLQEQRDKSFT